MPRPNPFRALPVSKWTDHERERGYRHWTDRFGREVVQCAPGRVFSLLNYPGIGPRVVEAGKSGPAPTGRTLPDLFRGPIPYLCVVLSNEAETGLVFATATPSVLPEPEPHSGELPDYEESRVAMPDPRPPLIGPISAEFLAGEVGFNAGRGERFLREFVFSGLIPARRAPGRKRIWEFEEAALSSFFPGEDWGRIMEKYRASKLRPEERGEYRPSPRRYKRRK